METFEWNIILLINLFVIQVMLSIDNILAMSTLIYDAGKAARIKITFSVLALHFAISLVLLLFPVFVANFWWLQLLFGLALLYVAQALFRQVKLGLHPALLVLLGGFVAVPFLQDNMFTALAFTSDVSMIELSFLLLFFVMLLFVLLYLWLVDRYAPLIFLGATVMLLEGLVQLIGGLLQLFFDKSIHSFLNYELFDLYRLPLVAVVFLCALAFDAIRRRRQNA